MTAEDESTRARIRGDIRVARAFGGRRARAEDGGGGVHARDWAIGGGARAREGSRRRGRGRMRAG